MNIVGNFEDGVSGFDINGLTIEELDNIRKSLYFAGWYNTMSPADIVLSIRRTYSDLVKAIENRIQYKNGILIDATSKISKP